MSMDTSPRARKEPTFRHTTYKYKVPQQRSYINISQHMNSGQSPKTSKKFSIREIKTNNIVPSKSKPKRRSHDIKRRKRKPPFSVLYCCKAKKISKKIKILTRNKFFDVAKKPGDGTGGPRGGKK